VTENVTGITEGDCRHPQTVIIHEVSDAFAVDIMSNTPAFDIAVNILLLTFRFADYVLENYIDVDSKFPSTLWAQPPDVSGAMPHTNNGAEAYHSLLNDELKREISQHYTCLLMYWRRFSKQRMLPWTVCRSTSQHALSMNETWDSLLLLYVMTIAHMFL